MNSTQKIALVTGGSRGLGRNTAIALSRKGIDVIVTYHTRKEDAEAVVKEIENNGRKAVALQLVPVTYPLLKLLHHGCPTC
ncbi:SDR family NAD(P)-dependent oxidoreductase [Pseudalkalibacillus sp. A8]|uniref:SDR family NAD(P)-dependent oxidoreductase n=1 Tax=Pseudalkalibacillus sp. A8 TaxID=3382641 RepID=UPI0038B68BD5